MWFVFCGMICMFPNKLILIQHHELKLDRNKANLTVEEHRLDNLLVPSMPWRPCINLCFFLLNILIIAK